MMYRKGTRKFGYRIAVSRNGVEWCNSIDAVGVPIVLMDSDAEIKRSITGSFRFPAETNFLKDQVRPFLILDGIEYPLGEYHITTKIDHTTETGGETTEIEAYDGGYLLKRSCTESRIHLSAGELYTDVIIKMLEKCGLWKIRVTASPLTLMVDREDWEIGTPYLRIINALLNEINYASIWFDNDGFARSDLAAVASVDNVKHRYHADEYSVIAPQRSSELDVFEKFNVFMAVVDGPDYPVPLVAKAEIDDPASPLSTHSRGRIHAPLESLKGIASLEELQVYVNTKRDKAMRMTQTSKIVTAIMPGHEVRDTVELDDGIYQEIGWQIYLSHDRQMSHTLAKEVYML